MAFRSASKPNSGSIYSWESLRNLTAPEKKFRSLRARLFNSILHKKSSHRVEVGAHPEDEVEKAAEDCKSVLKPRLPLRRRYRCSPLAPQNLNEIL